MRKQKQKGWGEMKNSIKYPLFILVVIAFCVSIFMGLSKAGSRSSLDDWIGGSVNVQLQRGGNVKTFEKVKLIAITGKDKGDGIIVKKGSTKMFIYHDVIYLIELN
jgi:hypothetical protein